MSTEEQDLAFALQLQAEFDFEAARNASKNAATSHPNETTAKSKSRTKKKLDAIILSTDDDSDNDSSKENLDYELARKLQKELDSEASTSSGAKSKGIIDKDLEYAKLLQEELSGEASLASQSVSKLPKGPSNIVDDNWELIDPLPDIHALFLSYNDAYFWGRLQGVEVRWSPKMTVCAGLCCYEGKGGLCSIRLSEPLLKLRPRRDLVQTLLHEMIHAFLFVVGDNKDHDAHGPEFHKHMDRINLETGTKITVYHSFHDEVNLYKTHWWRCDGPCKERQPYYGYVKRSMNRKPQPADSWWSQHQATCGGIFQKIKEPTSFENKRKNDKKSSNVPKKPKLTESLKKSHEASNSKDIRSFFDNKMDNSSATNNIRTLSNFATKAADSETSKPSQKGGFTKMNGGGTLTVTNKKNHSNEKNKNETSINAKTKGASNVFTISTIGSNSTPDKSPANTFSGQGRTLGSS